MTFDSIDTEVYNLDTGAKVAQWFPVQSFVPGQLITTSNSWQAVPGRYQVRLGVFTPTWGGIAWFQDGPIFQIS